MKGPFSRVGLRVDGRGYSAAMTTYSLVERCGVGPSVETLDQTDLPGLVQGRARSGRVQGSIDSCGFSRWRLEPVRKPYCKRTLRWGSGESATMHCKLQSKGSAVSECAPARGIWENCKGRHPERGERGGNDLLKGRLISWVNPRFFCAGLLEIPKVKAEAAKPGCCIWGSRKKALHVNN